ncbi:MAG TPA: hypothetical protein VGL08_08225 [Paraburkholderia sp.]|jgi:hypothetical protein
MNVLLMLLDRWVPRFQQADLPLDNDYSYEARHYEHERRRKLAANIAWFRI